MNFKKTFKGATMGDTGRLRPMILWTILENLLRGVPIGYITLLVLEIFKPLENPETPLNIQNIIWATVVLAIALIALFFVSRKAYVKCFIDGYKICNDGRLEAVKHLRKLPMGFYNQRDPGDVGSYIAADYSNIEMLVTHMIPQIIAAVSMPVISLIVVAFFNWKLALAAAIVIPLAYPASWISGKIISYFGKKLQKTKMETSSRMLEYIQGIRLIKAFNLSGSRFTRMENIFRKLKVDSIKIEAAPAPSINLSLVILNGGLVFIMLLGLSLLVKGDIETSIYIMFLILGMLIYSPLIQALVFAAEMNFLSLGVDRIEELTNTPFLSDGEIEEIENHDIEFKDIHFGYNENIPVINGVSLKIPEKTLTALIGPSGSGKTTLTRLIARFWDVDKGEISMGGNNIKDYPVDTLMDQISIVFQDVYLFKDTVYNNIRIGKENATRQEIIKAAKAAHCHDFIEQLPDGYDTQIGEGGSTLSGGEKQRISIARAILKDAPVILLDEATASLDPENERYIQKAIEDLVKNKTVIVIAHRLNTIMDADKIVVIDKGRVVQEGTHNDLIKSAGLYTQMWEEQEKTKGWRF